jgi:hypothetical protein
MAFETQAVRITGVCFGLCPEKLESRSELERFDKWQTVALPRKYLGHKGNPMETSHNCLCFRQNMAESQLIFTRSSNK